MKKKNSRSTVNLRDDDAIVLDNVTHIYTNAPVLKNVSLRIKKGEFVFIVGVSGSGKSTLIKLLLRELVATKGGVYVLGENLSTMKHRRVPAFRRRLGVVFQDFRLLKDMNVYDNVAFAQRVTQVPAKNIKKSVPAILKYVGLAGKYKVKPRHLSGGEQQRVALARAFVNQPEILLCDEPTGNLDPANSQEIMRLLEKFNQRGTTVVVVTHNKEIVDQMHKRVISLHRGVIESDVESGEYEAKAEYEEYEEFDAIAEFKKEEALGKANLYDSAVSFEDGLLDSGMDSYEDAFSDEDEDAYEDEDTYAGSEGADMYADDETSEAYADYGDYADYEEYGDYEDGDYDDYGESETYQENAESEAYEEDDALEKYGDYEHED